MQITTLKAIADIKTGHPLRRAPTRTQSGNLQLVQMSDVDPMSGVNWKSVARIENPGRKAPDYLEENEILFAGRGSRMFAVHVKQPPKDSVASPHFYVVHIKDKAKLSPRYLTWFLNSVEAQRYYARNIEGSALPYISRKILALIPVPMPSFSEQERIVDAYYCWKHQRKLLEELIEQKELHISKILEQTLHRSAK